MCLESVTAMAGASGAAAAVQRVRWRPFRGSLLLAHTPATVHPPVQIKHYVFEDEEFEGTFKTWAEANCHVVDLTLPPEEHRLEYTELHRQVRPGVSVCEAAKLRLTTPAPARSSRSCSTRSWTSRSKKRGSQWRTCTHTWRRSWRRAP